MRSLACLALVFAVSCSWSPGLSLGCTEIGCSDGLVVRLVGAPQGPWSIAVTSQGTTHTKECQTGGNCGGLMFFPDFEPQSVTVTVTRGPRGITYQDLTPTQQTIQPNGPGCEPTCNHLSVTVQPPPPP